VAGALRAISVMLVVNAFDMRREFSLEKLGQ
jgi:hypothetical protein